MLAPPAAREGIDGTPVARELAVQRWRAVERRLEAHFPIVQQAFGIRRTATCSRGASSRRRRCSVTPTCPHRDRFDTAGEPGHVGALPRHHRREPERRSGPAAGRGRTSPAACRLHPSAAHRPTSRRSFGEAGRLAAAI